MRERERAVPAASEAEPPAQVDLQGNPEMLESAELPGMAALPDEANARCPCCGAEATGTRCAGCGAARTAGGFRVRALLSQSDHARVYLAEDAEGRRVALKELLFSRVPDAQHLEAFEREASLLRSLRHPRIPLFVDAFRAGTGAETRLYLAQEHVAGESLLVRLGSRRFSAPEALALCREVLEVLGHLHQLSPPLVHRDVKPANLIVRDQGGVALIDFGTAREVRPGGTVRSTAVGTFGYMPPEQLGGSVDPSADLYALGATLVHLLTRRPPEEVLWADPRPPLAEAISAPAPVLAFLERLVAWDRRKRFPDAAAALRALDAAERDSLHLHDVPIQGVRGAAGSRQRGDGLIAQRWHAAFPSAPRFSARAELGLFPATSLALEQPRRRSFPTLLVLAAGALLVRALAALLGGHLPWP